MSVELVTGYSGVGSDGEPNRHVSSAEDGARQAGTVGLGCYVLSTGSKLSASMEDANTLVVADGDAIMYGRYVSMPDPTSFTIPTGVQGRKVSNLAILRYEVGASSVESVTPLVLTGEPSAGTPTDPAYNKGSILDGDSPVDFPLYRVVTNGVNAEDPVPLFGVLMPMADLWDSVSQLPASSENLFPTPAADWIYASAYSCVAGVAVGGNFHPASSIGANGTLLTINLPRDAQIASNMLLRGAFPNHQSGAKIELSGRTLRVRAESAESFADRETFSFFVPLTWL